RGCRERLPPPAVRSRTWRRCRGYWSSDRKPTRALNLFGGRFLNDGIGAVGFRRVDAIAPGRTTLPMCVRFGPGPLLPLLPITWQARQPDWPTTSSPAMNVCFSEVLRFAGGFSATE